MKRLVVIDGDCNETLSRELIGERVEFLRIRDGEFLSGHPETREVTHATVCSAILAEKVPDARIIVLSVVGEDGKQRADAFRTALEWCAGEKVDGITMSIGTQNWFDMQLFLPAVERLSRMGVRMVAAGHNMDLLTYPASLPEVCGVRYREDFRGIRELRDAWDGINAEVGFEEPEVLKRLRQEYDFRQKVTNSMAAPWFLGEWMNRSIFDAEQETETPVVAVSGTAERAEALACELRNRGYRAMLLSGRRQTDVKKGYFNLPPEDIPYERLWQYVRRIQADIFLLEADDSVYGGKDAADRDVPDGGCVAGFPGAVDMRLRISDEGSAAEAAEQAADRIEEFFV